MLFFNPLLGAAVGASAGALSGALSDIGINDDFMKEIGKTLTSNTSAIFVLVRNSTPDKVLDGLKQFSGKVQQAFVPHAKWRAGYKYFYFRITK